MVGREVHGFSDSPLIAIYPADVGKASRSSLAMSGPMDHEAFGLVSPYRLVDLNRVPLTEKSCPKVVEDRRVGRITSKVVELAGIGFEVEEDWRVIQAVDQLVASMAEHRDG